MDTEYSFDFTSKKGVPRAAAKGYIVVDFPTEFDIPNGRVPCYPESSFAENLNCEFYENSVRIQGNSEDVRGNIKLRLD